MGFDGNVLESENKLVCIAWQLVNAMLLAHIFESGNVQYEEMYGYDMVPVNWTSQQNRW